MNDLPLEMFTYIFKFLNLHEAVTIYSKTCVQWKETIALHVLSPEILKLAQSNTMFKKTIEQDGWTKDTNDPDFLNNRDTDNDGEPDSIDSDDNNDGILDIHGKLLFIQSI